MSLHTEVMLKKIIFILLSFTAWWVLADELIILIPTENYALLLLSALFWAPVFSVCVTTLSVHYFKRLNHPKLYWSMVTVYSSISLWGIIRTIYILYFE